MQTETPGLSFSLHPSERRCFTKDDKKSSCSSKVNEETHCTRKSLAILYELNTQGVENFIGIRDSLFTQGDMPPPKSNIPFPSSWDWSLS